MGKWLVVCQLDLSFFRDCKIVAAFSGAVSVGEGMVVRQLDLRFFGVARLLPLFFGVIRVGREVVEGLAERKLCTLSGLITSYDSAFGGVSRALVLRTQNPLVFSLSGMGFLNFR